MRILQVSNFFKPLWETGGVTRVNYEISSHLVKAGHDVTVYTTDGYGLLLEKQTNVPVDVEGIRLYYFKNLFKNLIQRFNLTFPYYLPFVLRKEIQNFDIIHIHEHRTLSAVIVHYYAKKYGVPYVLQSHGSVLPSLQRQNFKKIFDFIFGYSILQNATKVIALNENEAFQYQQMGINKKNIEVIPNGINLDEYKNLPSKGTFKAKYNISRDENIILYVGRVHKTKGIDLLIETVPLLLKKLPNIRVIVVGPDDGFQYKLEELITKLRIEKNVIFTGFVEKDVKMAALNDSNVFVTPTFTGFPISFLEACIFGLPIITTIKGDNLNWIHNKVGYVVQYDKDELCNAILNILKDHELTARFSNEMKNIVETEFSMSRCIKRIETLYMSIMQSKV